MQPWWSDERCWNFVPAWKHNPQVKEFLSLGSSDRGLICHCDDALSKSCGPFLSRDKFKKMIAMTMNRADKAAGHWAEGVPGWTANATSAFPKILLTETRTAAKKHQIPSAGSTSQTPKQRLFRPQENPRKQRWGCPGLFVVVLTSLVWAARSGPLLQSYWADRPASSLVRLFLTLYTTPSLPPSL